MIQVCEIFRSLQGEGIFTGVPSVFLRVVGCNMFCTWCDTPQRLDDGTPWQEQELAEHLGETLKQGDHLVFTGGEPTLQYEAFEQMVRLLKNKSWVTIETNGKTAIEMPMVDLISVSPKLKNSGNRLPTEPESVAALIRLNVTKYFQLKFVVDKPEDIEEISLFVKNSGINKEMIPVYLMPQAQTPEELQSKMLMVSELCKEHGFLFGDRLHVRIWGGRRGF
jgi:7-carboxy-7-deazaguanine synthase